LQLASVARAHLVTWCGGAGLLPGIETQAFIDIDSLLRPVYGHAKQGASFGHTKIAGRQVLRRGLSPLVTMICAATGAVVAGIRLRGGKSGSGKGAASMVREVIGVARAAGATGQILVRDDSAYGNRAVVSACVKAGARFSVVLAKNQAVNRAIGAIPVNACTSTSRPVTARLVVRRVRDRTKTDELFPVWRHHPFFTDSTKPTAQADITHWPWAPRCGAPCSVRPPGRRSRHDHRPPAARGTDRRPTRGKLGRPADRPRLHSLDRFGVFDLRGSPQDQQSLAKIITKARPRIEAKGQAAGSNCLGDFRPCDPLVATVLGNPGRSCQAGVVNGRFGVVGVFSRLVRYW
jgi:hypothetical protein